MIARLKLFPMLMVAAATLTMAGCTERPQAGIQATAAPEPSPSGDTAPTTANDSTRFTPVDDAQALLGLPASGTCSLENLVDMVDNTPSPGVEPNSYKANRSAPYKMIGFATDSDAGTVPAKIRVLLHGPSGGFALDGVTGSDRADVAKFFDKPGLAKSGYQIDVAFAGISPGIYEVHIVKDAEGEARLCPTHQSIVVE